VSHQHSIYLFLHTFLGSCSQMVQLGHHQLGSGCRKHLWLRSSSGQGRLSHFFLRRQECKEQNNCCSSGSSLTEIRLTSGCRKHLWLRSSSGQGRLSHFFIRRQECKEQNNCCSSGSTLTETRLTSGCFGSDQVQVMVGSDQVQVMVGSAISSSVGRSGRNKIIAPETGCSSILK
jgi:hypothetical protein